MAPLLLLWHLHLGCPNITFTKSCSVTGALRTMPRANKNPLANTRLAWGRMCTSWCRRRLH
eukprot:9635310-Lingulodinium_polyedra.AAC.1